MQTLKTLSHDKGKPIGSQQNARIQKSSDQKRIRKNIDAPDYMHKLLGEIAISFLNDQKISTGQPFRKELNESLGRILDQELS